MGQAKNRGPKEQRISVAIARQEALKPTEMICNECKTVVTAEHIYMLDTRNMEGIEMACSCICPTCESVTRGFKGTDEAVIAISALLAEEHPGAIASIQSYTRKS